jgi:lipopolysaccharide assembly outer membrane protein LptD (OstA)
MSRRIYICVFLATFLRTVPAATQQATEQDSLPNYHLTEQTDLDTLVEYHAQRIETDVRTRTTYLVGNAVVLYKGMQLQAGKITIQWNDNLLIAEAIPDTSADSTGNNGNPEGGPQMIGYPVFVEGGQSMTGEKMFYNFKTRKGRVVRGRTTYEEGFYTGNQVKRVSDKVYYVKGGTFTTCDLPEPHFYFRSDKMKMIYQDKVLARPIVMYIHHIPVAALPYGIFPYRKGRHSGILIPRYGQSATQGRYLRGFGYYWAPSDYWDTKLEVDYYEKTGFVFHSTTRYAIRYLLRGTISGSLVRQHYGERKQRRWDVRFSHSQTFSPTMHLTAYGSFVSDASFYRDFSANREQRLRREIRSNATLSKSWPASKNSLTINLSRSHMLDTDSKQEVFPQISFRHGQESLGDVLRYVGLRKRGPRRSRSWYDNIYFSYNSQLLNSRSIYRASANDTFRVSHFTGVRHSLTLSNNQRLFRYFNVNQSVSYTEVWQTSVTNYELDTLTNRIVERKEKGFFTRRIFQTSVGMNTKIYGFFPVSRWGIVAFRHVISPSLSFTFRPDFSDPAFGYYQVIRDTTGRTYKKDRFKGSAFGSTPVGGTKGLSISVRNLFQMKRLLGEKEKKMDLFSLDFSTFYNFMLDSMRLSPLRTSLRTSPSRVFNFTYSMTHSFYRYDPRLKKQVNQLLVKENPLSPLRLLSLSLNASLSLRHTMFQRKKAQKGASAQQDTTVAGELSATDRQALSPENRFEVTTPSASLSIPWEMNLSFRYSENHYNPSRVTKTIWLDLKARVKLTKNWRISYQARWDLHKRKVVAQDISVYRDLHCWEAQFFWTPTGPYKRYYLKINIKSSLLESIKLEKRGGRTAIFGY